MIPKTTGYTEIVKAIEAGLNGDKETCRKYIERFVIKFPVESDLTYAFRHLLEGNKNPDGLTLENQPEIKPEDKIVEILKKNRKTWYGDNPPDYARGYMTDYDLKEAAKEIIKFLTKKP